MPTNVKPVPWMLLHERCFLVPLVAKRVLQKKQEFKGVTLLVKPYEESIKKDNHSFEVRWCIALKFDVHVTRKIGCLLYSLSFFSCFGFVKTHCIYVL